MRWKLRAGPLKQGLGENGPNSAQEIHAWLATADWRSRFKPDRLNVHIAYELRTLKYSSLYSAMRVERDLFLRCTPHFPCRNEPHSV